MRRINSIVVVTGIHRSGTTIVGQAVKKVMVNSKLVYEPMNFRLGVKGVPCWYPYLPSFGGVPVLEELLDGVLALNVPYKRWVRLHDEPLLKSITRAIVGSRNWRSAVLARFCQASPKIYKDPFMVLMSGYLASKYDAKVIVMVRHPVAFFLSLRRKEWFFDVAHLQKQPMLREKLPWLEEIPDASPLELQAAVLWRAVYDIIFDLKNEFPDNILLIRHEDFGVNPVKVIGQVTDFLRVSPQSNDAINEFLRRITSGEKVVSDKVHDFNRAARKLVHAWEPYANLPRFRQMKGYIGDVFYRYYEKWDAF